MRGDPRLCEPPPVDQLLHASEINASIAASHSHCDSQSNCWSSKRNQQSSPSQHASYFSQPDSSCSWWYQSQYGSADRSNIGSVGLFSRRTLHPTSTNRMSVLPINVRACKMHRHHDPGAGLRLIVGPGMSARIERAHASARRVDPTPSKAKRRTSADPPGELGCTGRRRRQGPRRGSSDRSRRREHELRRRERSSGKGTGASEDLSDQQAARLVHDRTMHRHSSGVTRLLQLDPAGGGRHDHASRPTSTGRHSIGRTGRFIALVRGRRRAVVRLRPSHVRSDDGRRSCHGRRRRIARSRLVVDVVHDGGDISVDDAERSRQIPDTSTLLDPGRCVVPVSEVTRTIIQRCAHAGLGRSDLAASGDRNQAVAGRQSRVAVGKGVDRPAVVVETVDGCVRDADLHVFTVGGAAGLQVEVIGGIRTLDAPVLPVGTLHAASAASERTQNHQHGQQLRTTNHRASTWNTVPHQNEQVLSDGSYIVDGFHVSQVSPASGSAARMSATAESSENSHITSGVTGTSSTTTSAISSPVSAIAAHMSNSNATFIFVFL